MNTNPPSLVRQLAIRAAVFAAPLLLYYVWTRHALEAASQQTHRGDTGLGLAIVLFLVCGALLLAFGIDLIMQIIRKKPALVIFDLLLLAFLLSPIGWFGCNMWGSRDSAPCRVLMASGGSMIELLE